ncbi:hypothetical protein HDC37_000830 [Microbacterium sp. AK009]|uniref:hypothetical protein n=1 Tax=Microbacterium sp. AK009 TaxID=2723068 RepID=UPI0015CDFCC0|nr:hypothetical protein [Microbacterium sp. AK009]NYF16016.1 hypothetical protein [Microbacterium sp. AK009]
MPLDLELGLLSGDFIRYGGVVRDTAGRLVTHLKEIPTPEVVVEGAKRAALSLKNPWVVVGMGVLTLVAVGGGVVIALSKRKKDAEPVIPECVQNYTEALRAYLDAIQNGALDADIIDRLIVNLDAVIAYGEEGDTTVAFSPDQLATLTNVVLDYTAELAKANDFELDGPETPSTSTSTSTDGGEVVDLRRYLELQRRIFGEAA